MFSRISMTRRVVSTRLGATLPLVRMLWPTTISTKLRPMEMREEVMAFMSGVTLRPKMGYTFNSSRPDPLVGW